MTTDADGQVVKRTDVTPKVVRMTDGTGKYRAKETVPAYGEEVYIYTSYIGVPMLYKTKVVGNTITADINWDTAAQRYILNLIYLSKQSIYFSYSTTYHSNNSDTKH